MAGDLGKLVAFIEAREAGFTKALQLSTGQLDRVAAQAERTNDRIARSTSRLDAVALAASRGFPAVGVAVAAVGAATVGFASKQVRMLDQLGETANQTGIAADELRRLQVLLDTTGAGADESAGGLRRFATELGKLESGTGTLHST